MCPLSLFPVLRQHLRADWEVHVCQTGKAPSSRRAPHAVHMGALHPCVLTLLTQTPS